MKTSHRPLSRLVLAAAFSALPQVTASAADNEPPAPPPPYQAPPPPSAPPANDLTARTREEIERQAEEAAKRIQAAQQRAEAAQVRASAAAGGASGGTDPIFIKSPMIMTRTSFTEAPAIVVTQPLDAAAEAEWKEDLTIMDKLLRDEINRIGEDANMALGIRLTSLGRTSPSYVEGAGVVFSFSVSMPLAAGDASSTAPTKPRERTSLWDATKRQLDGRRDPKQPVSPPQFNPTQYKNLIEGVFKLLPEASNIRQLKKEEFVFVTISGVDDAGTPRRITFKASKSDLDDAAEGKISPETFRERVASNVQ